MILMPSITIPIAIAGAGAIGAVGGVASGLIGAGAAKSAGAQQAAAANQASANTMTMFNKTQANLAPFVQGGTSAFNELLGLTGGNAGGNPLTAPLTAPFQPTMAQLSQTPGYQFALQQGELATQDSFAAQGLGTSGAAMKGAANYAEGLASTTYQQQFQNYLQQNQQIYGMLGGLGQTGENSAAMTGQQGLTATGQAGQFSTAAAAAGAAGTIGQANALTGAIGGVTGAANQTALMLALNNSGLFGGSGNDKGVG